MMLLRSLIDSTMRIALSAGSPGVVQSGGRGSGSGGTVHTVVITDVGTTSYAFPVGSTSRSVICIGSGADGDSGGAGGGGGGWSKTALTNDEVTYHASVDSTSEGSGTTKFLSADDNTIYCLARSADGDTGGSASSGTGDTKHSGGNGGAGIGSGGGGGGGAAGTTGNGSNGADGDGITAALGGSGGGGSYSGAGGDGELAGGDVGDAGDLYGGGGGGGCPNPLATHPGLASQGVIITQYTL